MTAKRLPWLAMTLALVAAAGCQRDPLEQKVRAPTASAFATWRSGIDSDSNLETRRRVGEALLEIRLHIAGNREIDRVVGKPPPKDESIDDALRKKVDGRPLREVLQLGYEMRQLRLSAEMAGLENAMRRNTEDLVTRPGDTASRRHLDELNARQAKRVAQYRADLAATTRELELLLKVNGRRLLETPEDRPDEGPQRVK